MSALEGAAIPVNYFTAWQLCRRHGRAQSATRPYSSIRRAAASALRRRRSPSISARKVIGTASAAKHAELRALGVDHLIDYRTEDFEARTREITGGRGVELILDAVGGKSWKKGYRILAPTGRLGMFGISRGAAGKERNMLGMLSMLARTPWFQFNPLVAHECEQGRVRRQSRPHVGRGRSHARMGRCSCSICGRKALIKPKIARELPLRRSSRPRITSFKIARTSAKCCWCHSRLIFGRSLYPNERARPKPRSAVDCSGTTSASTAAAARRGCRASASSSPADRASWPLRR